MPTATEQLVTGNHFDKYRSGNPVHRFLVNGFCDDASSLLQLAQPQSVLEIGCGPGDLAWKLRERVPTSIPEYLGMDICPHQVAIATERYPELSFRAGSAYELPVPDASYDLCLACEVLEHLGDPRRAINEMARVARRYVLISVPWEPVWRILNCARGRYLTRLGNTPGHVGHYTRRRLRALIASHFTILHERRPFPWTMILAEQPRNTRRQSRPMS